jgi:thioredoxin 1
MKKILLILSVLVGLFFLQADDTKTEKQEEKKEIKYQATFIELGSNRCIPCQKMKPVMEHIEKEYKDKVKVIFYDVWEKDQRKFAEEYKIKLIPTQVFLDANGKEFFRHEGFFSIEKIEELLTKQGITK